LVLGILGSGLWQMAAPPEGPVAVPFDRVSCARCRMLVSEPRFAAQLHDATGSVHFFDDPGCALLYRAGTPGARHLYFGHASGEAWLAESEVAFERVPESPMGYGFAAVPRGMAGDTLDASQVFALLDAAGPEARP
jgi:copper chaperone NosL